MSTNNLLKRNGNSSDFPFSIGNKLKFRLPTGEDELAVMGYGIDKSAEVLVKRCIPELARKINLDDILKTMQEFAPLSDAEIEAQCPECSKISNLHFSLQQYLLSSLLKEHDILTAEIHLLARTYGWGLNEILSLPRGTRRSFVAAITNE